MDGSIGQPVIRRDAAAKASGVAQYAADFPHVGTAYAALVTSKIARGRITRIDTKAAEAVPGVQMILTHHSLNEGLGEETFAMKGGHMQSSFMPLTSDEVHYAGQIVSLVIADTQEDAEQAAGLVAVDYATQHASAAMDDPGHEEEPMEKKAIDVGDALTAFADADVSVDATYLTPAQHHNPIELYAATAVWRDGKLLVNTPSQWVRGKQAALAKIFGIPMEDVHIEIAIHRRRVRRQGDLAGAYRAGGDGRAPAGPPGKAGGAARGDVHGGLVPPRHAQPRPPRRQEGRHADCRAAR